MNEIQQPTGPAHVSASQLKTFIQCPRKYFFSYIERKEPAFRPIAFAFGSAWHHTIGLALTHQNKTREELAENLRDGLRGEIHANEVPVLFEDDEDEGMLVDRAVTMLGAFLDAVPLPEKVYGVELAFSVDLYDPVTGEVLPASLIGAIDAVVEDNGKPVIWELKTGKRRWPQDQLDFDLQPSAYGLGARELGYESAGIELVLTTKASKPAVQRERLVRGSADERDLMTTAASVLRAVEGGVDHPIRGWQCRGCPYATECR